MRRLLFALSKFFAVLFGYCPACGETLESSPDHYRGYEPYCPWCDWDDYMSRRRRAEKSARN